MDPEKMTAEERRRFCKKKAQLRAVADQFTAALQQHEREEGCEVRPCCDCRASAFEALKGMVIEDIAKELR